MNFRVNRLLAVPFPALRRLIGLCGLAAALSLSVAPPAAAKDALVVGWQDSSVSLDPAICYELSGTAILNQVYERLVAFRGEDLTTPVPEIAESWDIGSDGKTWTFHLRPGKVFASGHPIDADAVVFSLRRFIRLGGEASSMLTQFGVTETAITKIDAATVQIVFDRQYAPLLILSCLGGGGTGMALDPQVVRAHEQDGDLGKAWLFDHSAGSGPYVVADHKQGELTTLQANPRYAGEKKPYQRVTLKHVGDEIEQMAMLERGARRARRGLESAPKPVSDAGQ